MVENLVVISYWSQRSIKPLQKLIDQIYKINSGAIFDTLIVCNGDKNKVTNFLSQSNLSNKIKVIERENYGFNIGAWDAGWRYLPDYQNFLFLQDDCFICRENWLQAFINKFQNNPQLGLLGESLKWKMSWNGLVNSHYNNYHRSHTLNGKKMRKIDLYRAYLAKKSIQEGEYGDHLQSLILFTSKPILELVDGFPLGKSYGEAIASEIAISKKVQAAGYQIEMVDSNNRFYYISHPQWQPKPKGIKRLLYWLKSKV